MFTNRPRQLKTCPYAGAAFARLAGVERRGAVLVGDSKLLTSLRTARWSIELVIEQTGYQGGNQFVTF